MAALPETGITTSVVGNALGTTSRDVGTLCTHDNINIWSKNKPVRYNTTSPITDDQRESTRWGIEVWSGNSPSQVITKYIFLDSFESITYNAPTGGTASPYRLGDFAGYNHDATAPVLSNFRSITTLTVSDSWMSMQAMEQITTDSSILSRDEIYYSTDSDGNVEELNYCVAIKSGSTSTEVPRWSVGGIPWNNSLWDGYKGKTCKVYEFFTNIPSGNTSANYVAQTTDKFFCFPECMHEVYFQKQTSSTGGSSSEEFMLSGVFTVTGLSVSGTVVVSSIGTGYTGGTITSLKAVLYDNNSATGSPQGSRTIVASGSSVTVGSETSKTYTTTIIPEAVLNVYYVQIICTTGNGNTLSQILMARESIDLEEQV